MLRIGTVDFDAVAGGEVDGVVALAAGRRKMDWFGVCVLACVTALGGGTVRDTLLGHYEDMLLHYGVEPGMRVARKHIGWYSKGLPGSAEFRAAVNRVHDPAVARDMIRAFYLPLAERAVA